MNHGMIYCKIAGLLAAIGAQIAIADAATIARSASESHVLLRQPHQLSAVLQPSSVRVLLDDVSSAYDQMGNTSRSIGGRQAGDAEPRDHQHFEDVQYIASRGLPNELLDAVQSRPLEALGSAAEASSSLAPTNHLSGTKRKSLDDLSEMPRSKRKLTVSTAPLPASEVDGRVALSRKRPAYKDKIWPIWDKSHEARWSAFVKTSKDMNELLSDKNHVRRKVWRRVKRRKERAIASGNAERSKRANGLVGLSSDDVKQLESADLGQALIIQQRMAARVRAMEADKPAADSEKWGTWKQNMQAEEDALAQVVGKVQKLKAERHATDERKASRRPHNFIGLTKNELDLFRSDDVFERNTLRQRLSVRISETEKFPTVRDPQHRNPQLNADLAWRQGIELRKYYPAKDIESQIPQVLEGAASLSTEDAAKQIPMSLKRMVSTAKAASEPAPDPVPAAGARHSVLPVSVRTNTPSTAVNQSSSTRPQHDLEAAHHPSTLPTEQRQAPLAGKLTLPPWLRKALDEPGLRPKSSLHLASGSGTSTGLTDAAVHQHAVGPSAQTQPARVSAQNANADPTQEQDQQTRQPAVLLDLFH